MEHGQEFDFGVAALSEYDEDGHLGIAVDHCGEDGKPGAPPAAAITPFGFSARPLDPDKDGSGTVTMGCGLLWWRNGDQLNAMPLDDPRVVKLLPKLRKGGTMQFCAAGSYALFDGEDPAGQTRAGSYLVAAKYGSKSHLLSMNVRKDGKEQVSLKHGEGHGVEFTAGGKRSAILRNAGGNGYFEANDERNVIAGKTTVQGALTVGGAAATSVAKAEPLITVLEQLIDIVAAINATTTGAPAAGLTSQLAAIKASLLKAV